MVIILVMFCRDATTSPHLPVRNLLPCAYTSRGHQCDVATLARAWVFGREFAHTLASVATKQMSHFGPRAV